MVESLYPHFPKALHDRLLDIFNKMDDLKDNDRHIVTALLQTVSQKHPEVLEDFDMLETIVARQANLCLRAFRHDKF